MEDGHRGSENVVKLIGIGSKEEEDGKVILSQL